MRPGLLLLGFLLLALPSSHARESVILLHGLSRSAKSMQPMAAALEAAGYHVLNVDYPSRSARVEELANTTLDQVLQDPTILAASRVHFVTHSLGGILVRSYLSGHSIPNLGRVVMLGPPNLGSEVVDRLGGLALFTAINGPAGSELGTGADSVPNRLGPVGFEVGVIAGDRSINWINSLMIAGADDGKVSVTRTRVAGMQDHLVLHTTHPFMMKNRQVIAQSLHFLQTGRFDRK